MALSKRTYVGGTTKITAANLNDIQDSIIALEGKGITKKEVVNALEYTPQKLVTFQLPIFLPTRRRDILMIIKMFLII